MRNEAKTGDSTHQSDAGGNQLPNQLHPSDPLAGMLSETLDWLTRLFADITLNPRPAVTERFGLEDAIQYFVQKHPGDPSIVAGAVLRQSHPGGHLIFQVFLDHDERICLDDQG